MESIVMGDHEDHHLTNSIHQVHPQDQDQDDVGPETRSYECIFCRRGFTTAQALGGHMNIHRKDRAKSKPHYLSNDHNSNKQENHSFYANPKFHHPIFAQSYGSITPDNLSSTSSNYENNHQDCHGVIKSPSREEKMMNLSLQFGWSHEDQEDDDDDEELKRRIRSGRNHEDDLDLELRLGPDP